MQRIVMATLGCVVAAGLLGASQGHAQVLFKERLRSPHPESNSSFGQVIAGGPDGLLVAQPGASYMGLSAVGAAYVYNAGNPASPVELRPQFPLADARYGTSLSAWNRLLIGAPGGTDGSPGAARGVVEAWRYVIPDMWERYSLLAPPAADLGTGFGQSIALDAFDVLVGFPGKLDGSRTSGAALLFTDDIDTWTYGGSFTSADDDLGFGQSVAITNGRAFVGEPGGFNGNGSSGRIAYYQNGAPADTLLPPDGEAQAFGGYHLEAYDPYLLVGVPYPLDAQGEPLPGRVYVYERDANLNYAFSQTLTAPDGHPGDGFGTSMAVYQLSVMVGAPGMTVAGETGAGAAWLFSDIGFQFTPDTKLVSTFPVANGHFGESVSMNFGYDVGAPGEPDGLLPGAGAVYRFEVDFDVIFKGTFEFN
jgi:hypothetical protein